MSWGRSGACTFTLTPIPSTTRPLRASARMPAVLRPPTRMSFGSLIPGARPVTRAIASAPASPATRVSSGSRAVSTGGSSRSEKSRLTPGGDSQLRPSRPRPSVCSSVSATAPSECSSPRSRCVEAQTSTKRYGRPKRPRRLGTTNSGASDEATADYTRPPVPIAAPLTRAEIEEILPHRDPFLLLDEVVEREPGHRVVARKRVRPDEWYLAGHFPGRPIMPGVLIVEAMAQTGAVAVLCSEENRGRLALFAGIDGVRFKRIVEPGDELELTCELERVRGPIGKGRAEARVGGELAARGTLTFAVEPE